MKRSVFITGVCGGIGAQIGKLFNEKGWNVIGMDLSYYDTGYDLTFFEKDVSSEEDVIEVAEELKKAGIKLHAIVNNAATQIERELIDTTFEEWSTVINTNLTSIYLTTRYMHSFLNEGKSAITNVSSVHAKATSKGLAAYVASKGGVSALTRAMALELASKKIRVNAVLPGAIKTPMLERGFVRNDDPEKARQNLINSTPLNRIGKPNDVANLVYFLSDNGLSDFITGQEFVADGGVLAKLASE